MLIVPAVELKTGHLRSIMCTANRHQIWINLPWCRVQQKSVTCQWKSGSYVDLWTLKCAFSLVKKFDSWTAHCAVLWTTVNMRLPMANSGISYGDQHVAQLIETWTVKQLPRFLAHPTHTHRLTALFSGTTRVSRYQKGKTNLDFTEAKDSEWQWHQLGHVQVYTSSLQTNNHTSNPPLKCA